MGKPVGVLVRNADELAAVRVGNPFLAAPQPFAGTPSRPAVKRVGHLEPLGSEAASESPGVF
jgi:hypothetical protein